MQAGSSLPWEAYVNLVHTTAKNRNLDLSKAAEAVASLEAYLGVEGATLGGTRIAHC